MRCGRQGDELQLNLRIGSETERGTASFSQPSLHLTLDTQTQDMAGDCTAQLPPTPDAAAGVPESDAVPPAAADAPSEAGRDAAQRPAPPESAQQQPPLSSGAGGSSSDSDGEEPPAQPSDTDSDDEAISGAGDAAPGGSSSSSSSDSESDDDDDAQVTQVACTR